MHTLNLKDDGYRGIWYMNQPSDDEYVYKYSGGLGTYCANHRPFAVYAPHVDKTFFCYGGATRDSSQQLVHMVSYYDHATGTVPRPTRLLDKQTDDAHDNPVISLDAQGHIWIFSTSHGLGRPSYIHRSARPHDIDTFEQVHATRETDEGPTPFDNFSYMQVWSRDQGGFVAFVTHYRDPAARTNFFMHSEDGVRWSAWQRLAAIQEGHYQISAARGDKAATTFNYHPQDPERSPGLNWRTNLYYMETTNLGRTWHAADGRQLDLPLTEVHNPALVHDYEAQGLLVYQNDIQLDAAGHPVLLYVTSKGFACGPANGPRTWTIAHWDGAAWRIKPAMTSDNNYDFGSLYLEPDGTWRIIGPTQPGPQPYNPGGEVAMWVSHDQGDTWRMQRQMTAGSERNHTYVRRPVDAHPDFYALWADGHARQPSISRLYFSDRAGNVRLLPDPMDGDTAVPALQATEIRA